MPYHPMPGLWLPAAPELGPRASKAAGQAPQERKWGNTGTIFSLNTSTHAGIYPIHKHILSHIPWARLPFARAAPEVPSCPKPRAADANPK